MGEGLAAGATARARGEGAGRGATAQGARRWRKGANTRARSSRRCERAVERTRGSGGAGAGAVRAGGAFERRLNKAMGGVALCALLRVRELRARKVGATRKKIRGERGFM